jgi:hypothetical protein
MVELCRQVLSLAAGGFLGVIERANLALIARILALLTGESHPYRTH